MANANAVHRALGALTQHLEQRQASGETRIWLTPQARKALRDLPAVLGELDRLEPAPAAGATAGESSSDGVVREEPAPVPASGPESTPSVKAEEVVALPGPVEALAPEGKTQREKLRWLALRAKSWEPARELDSFRDTMVFAKGEPNADLMIVCDAPGAEEERQKEPVAGGPGQLLDKMLKAMGLKREAIYLTHLVKFRPALPNQGESQRKPTSGEMACFLPLIKAEIEVVRPKVIVIMGATAVEGLLGMADPVARLRQQFYEFEKVPTLVTHHPSYLLTNPALCERRKVWEDWLMAMEKLNLPISEKQRGYFLS